MKKILIIAMCSLSTFVSNRAIYVINNLKHGDKVVFSTDVTDLSLDEAQKLGIKINPNCTYRKIDEIKETYKGGTFFQKKINKDVISSKYIQSKHNP